MKWMEDSLRVFLVVVLAVMVMFILRHLLRDTRSKEGFDNYCESAFTAKGTEIKLTSLANGQALDVDKNKVNDNLKLVKSDPTTWDLERVIMEDTVGTYPETKRPDSCAVMLKTTGDLPFYMTSDLGKVNSVGATPIGGSLNQVWYVLRLRPGVKGPKENMMDALYAEAVKNTNNNQKLLNDLYLVTTSPKDLTNDPKYPPARYLTVRPDSRSVVEGDLYLQDMPSIDSVWIVNYIKKGKVSVPAFEPSVGIGAYPDKKVRKTEGPYPSKYGAFMPSFLRIWNRTFWSPGLVNRMKNQSYLFQISVNLEPPNYKDQETFARGTATIKLIDGLRLNVEDPSKNPDISHQIKHNVLPSNPTFEVMTVGDDMLVGHKKDEKTKKNSTLIIQLLPKGLEKVTVPMIKGWLIDGDEGAGSITPLCALPQKGVIQNLMGVCQALLPGMDLDKFMLTHGFSPMDANNNFNISKGLVTASQTKRPVKKGYVYMCKTGWCWHEYD